MPPATARAEEASGTTTSEIAIIEHAPSVYHGTLLDPPVEQPELTLRDTAGRPFSLTDRPRDGATAVFFGYTHCPDVCPTTMADLAAARRQLPSAVRDRVTVAFVTEDPERDTPQVLRTWLDGFDPDYFVGLLGGNADTERVLEELYLARVQAHRHPDPCRRPSGGRAQASRGLRARARRHRLRLRARRHCDLQRRHSPRQYAEDLARLASDR